MIANIKKKLEADLEIIQNTKFVEHMVRTYEANTLALLRAIDALKFYDACEYEYESRTKCDSQLQWVAEEAIKEIARELGVIADAPEVEE